MEKKVIDIKVDLRKISVDDLAGLSLDKLMNFLDHESSHIRDTAVREIGKYGPAAEPAIPKLIEMFDSESDSIQSAIARTIGKIGSAAKPAIPKLLSSLNNSGLLGLQEKLHALGNICKQPKKVIPYLINYLTDDHACVKNCAAEAIGKYGKTGKDAIPYLIDLVDKQFELIYGDDISDVIRALDKIGAEEIRDPDRLIKLLRSSWSNVREAAINIVESLLKKQIGDRSWKRK